MKSCQLILGICVFAILSSFVVESAQAHDAWHHGGYGRYSYDGYRSSISYRANHSARPYFAVNPPVYYGNVRPRDYGWSPYPYRSHGARAASAATRIAPRNSVWEMRLGTGPRIRNPYFEEAESAVEVSDKQIATVVEKKPVSKKPASKKPVSKKKPVGKK
ncbi:MAG: hypothetical protein ABGX22_02360 [Pirellulaceae bacterium]|nr:hypothetical protein [Planctomycetaceae bacterium]